MGSFSTGFVITGKLLLQYRMFVLVLLTLQALLTSGLELDTTLTNSEEHYFSYEELANVG